MRLRKGYVLTLLADVDWYCSVEVAQVMTPLFRVTGMYDVLSSSHKEPYVQAVRLQSIYRLCGSTVASKSNYESVYITWILSYSGARVS